MPKEQRRDPLEVNIKIETILVTDTKQLRLGWMIHEQMNTTNNTYDYSDKAFRFDDADEYRSTIGISPKEKHTARKVYTNLEILSELKGKPWNNLALDAVLALRPYAIRVTKDYVTCDSIGERVTVWLEKDDRTIRKIDMEVSPAAIGVKTGQDFSTKLAGCELPPPSDEPIVYINEEAIKKIRI